MFWGQLHQILFIGIDPIPLAIPPKIKAQTLLPGIIHTCSIESHHNTLNIHYYKNHGHTEVVNLNTIQCCVS